MSVLTYTCDGPNALDSMFRATNIANLLKTIGTSNSSMSY